MDEDYVNKLLTERAEKDSSFKFDSFSPFNRDTTIEFSDLKYFEPDGRFIFKSKLHPYSQTDTVFVLGTKGELRLAIKEGFVKLMFEGREHRVNVYKSFSRGGVEYHSIWFTDKTTGKETYGVGRYLDFEKVDDSEHIYTIDFNRAYNPYCAYSSLFTCPIPREEDFIDIKIKAGEKNFH